MKRELPRKTPAAKILGNMGDARHRSSILVILENPTSCPTMLIPIEKDANTMPPYHR